MNNHPDWDILAESIADGEAVLVLGPDAIPFYQAKADPDGQKVQTSFSQLSRERIINKLEGGISQYYKRDNLFQFKHAMAKQKAMKCIREAGRDKSWLPDQELLSQIVAMPFPLILSINPDNYLYEAFCGLWQTPQFDYFTAKDKPASGQLRYPDGDEAPIIYKLCGSVEHKLDSVILDYYDLFELLKNILADNGVPEAVTRKLQEADRFILLGFELDRWYFQLFLHYLNKLDANPFNNFNQNFPILSNVSEDSKAFIMKQFNIEYFGTTRDDFDALYQACEQKQILRKITYQRMPAETNIRVLVSQGKITEAIKLLEQEAQDETQKLEMAHLQSRYSEWGLQNQNQILSAQDRNTELNRIKYTLLTYAHEWLKNT